MQTSKGRLLVFGCLVILNISVFAGDPKEPNYGGKTLSQWLVAYENAEPESKAEQQAVKSIQSIGTNALPFLISWIKDTSGDHYLQAPNGFKILGEKAAPAIPELEKMLRTSTNQMIEALAGTSLGNIGKPALPVLLSAFTNATFRVATVASLGIRELGTNARPAIPILLADLQHRNHFYQERAADTLGSLAIEPEIVIPELTNLLKEKNPALRFLAIQGLENFGREAISSIPALKALMKDVDPDLRKVIQEAINTIKQDSRSPGEQK